MESAGSELHQGFRLDLRRDLDLAHLGGGAARPLPLRCLRSRATWSLNRWSAPNPAIVSPVAVSGPVRLMPHPETLLSFLLSLLPRPFCAARPTMRFQADGDLTVVELPDDITAARANPAAASGKVRPAGARPVRRLERRSWRRVGTFFQTSQNW